MSALWAEYFLLAKAVLPILLAYLEHEQALLRWALSIKVALLVGGQRHGKRVTKLMWHCA